MFKCHSTATFHRITRRRWNRLLRCCTSRCSTKGLRQLQYKFIFHRKNQTFISYFTHHINDPSPVHSNLRNVVHLHHYNSNYTQSNVLATSQRRKSAWRSSSISAAFDNPDNKSLPAGKESKIRAISLMITNKKVSWV